MNSTEWNIQDYLKTPESVANYLEAAVEYDDDKAFDFLKAVALEAAVALHKQEERWVSESDAANDCIVEILESYMEFINIMESTLNCYAELPDKIETMAKTLIAKRRNDWKPILEKAKKTQKSAKKSA